MTALPERSGHLYTIAEYMELGENEDGYTELIEGRLIMSPSPVPDHNVAGYDMAFQLKPQLPEHLEIVPNMDVDLEFAEPGEPGSVRRPDLIIVDRQARRRVRHEGGLIRASDVAVIVEIVSLVACHLAGEFGYQDSEVVTGEFSTTVPFPVTLRLDQLL